MWRHEGGHSGWLGQPAVRIRRDGHHTWGKVRVRVTITVTVMVGVRVWARAGVRARARARARGRVETANTPRSLSLSTISSGHACRKTTSTCGRSTPLKQARAFGMSRESCSCKSCQAVLPNPKGSDALASSHQLPPAATASMVTAVHFGARIVLASATGSGAQAHTSSSQATAARLLAAPRRRESDAPLVMPFSSLSTRESRREAPGAASRARMRACSARACASKSYASCFAPIVVTGRLTEAREDAEQRKPEDAKAEAAKAKEEAMETKAAAEAMVDAARSAGSRRGTFLEQLQSLFNTRVVWVGSVGGELGGGYWEGGERTEEG